MPDTERPTWEYRVIDTGSLKNNTVSTLEAMLNEMGADGWELIRSTPNSPTAVGKSVVQYIFKRQPDAWRPSATEGREPS